MSKRKLQEILIVKLDGASLMLEQLLNKPEYTGKDYADIVLDEFVLECMIKYG